MNRGTSRASCNLTPLVLALREQCTTTNMGTHLPRQSLRSHRFHRWTQIGNARISCSLRAHLCNLWLLLFLTLLPTTAFAQKEPPAKAVEYQAEAFAAMDRGDYPQAETLLRKQLALDENNFVIYYNLACVRAMQKDGPGSANLITDAINRGFCDLYQLKRDPQLSLTRKQPPIQKLIDIWPQVLDQRLEDNLQHVRLIFTGKPKPYELTRDERLRLVYLSAMDAQSTEQARADISRLCDWGFSNVFPDLADPDKARLDSWCVVVLPTPHDFVKWAVANYGQSAANGNFGIGGAYAHDSKQLVAQDLGATLRHEFFHVLHWRDTVRRGQDHPIWIQEGLCSLVEDYEVAGEAATLKPVPSWRTNISKRLASGGKLMPIKQLASISRERFSSSSPLANYAQARTFFLYLFEKGRLKDWYAAYTEGYRTDPTGVKAVEEVFGKPIADVDKDYKAWVRGLPMVAEQIKPGEASLGVDVDPGNGDGPVIAEIPSDRRGPINPSRKAGLKVGDVITAIDGKPTRDLNELVRLLGEHEVGQEVEVSYRRGSTHGTTKVTLVRR